jgi:predicted metal-dependent hydrolase
MTPEVDGMSVTEHDLKIVVAAAHEHAKRRQWLGYPEMLLEARAIDEAADRLSASYRGAVAENERLRALNAEFQRTMDQQAHRISEQEARIGDLLAAGGQ